MPPGSGETRFSKRTSSASTQSSKYVIRRAHQARIKCRESTGRATDSREGRIFAPGSSMAALPGGAAPHHGLFSQRGFGGPLLLAVVSVATNKCTLLSCLLEAPAQEEWRASEKRHAARSDGRREACTALCCGSSTPFGHTMASGLSAGGLDTSWRGSDQHNQITSLRRSFCPLFVYLTQGIFKEPQGSYFVACRFL